MGFGYGYDGWFGHAIGFVVHGIITLVVFAVIVGLIVLLVRFLLVATTAAKLYVAKNSAPAAVAPAAPVTPPAPPAPPAKPGKKTPPTI